LLLSAMHSTLTMLLLYLVKHKYPKASKLKSLLGLILEYEINDTAAATCVFGVQWAWVGARSAGDGRQKTRTRHRAYVTFALFLKVFGVQWLMIF